MKILHINTDAYNGGAAIAAFRHCQAMSQNGVEAHLLTLGSEDNNLLVKHISSNSKIERFKYIQKQILRFVRHKIVWTSLDYGYIIDQHELVKNADIIYIHFIDGMLNYDSIELLLKTKKPIIWFMHDMGPITGGCHYSFDCRGYEMDCSHCPQLRFFKFLSNFQLEKKIKHWSNYENFYLAAPSNWLADCIRKSTLFKSKKVFVCPNVIDTDFFKPLDKHLVRKELGLPLGKKLIIFSATGLANPYKGIKYLYEALSKIENSDYECLVLGVANPEQLPSSVKIKMHLLGYIKDHQQLCKIYNAADVLLVTSIAENFPNVIIEAMSCGVPTVGFSTGGIVDQIHHKENGYLVKTGDVNGLVEGVNWVLNTNSYKELANSSRQYVLNNCSYINALKNHNKLLETTLQH